MKVPLVSGLVWLISDLPFRLISQFSRLGSRLYRLRSYCSSDSRREPFAFKDLPIFLLTRRGVLYDSCCGANLN